MATLPKSAALFIRPNPSVEIKINGEPREFSNASLRLSELVEQLALAPQRIAVEVNRQIVRRADWEKAQLHDGDRVEIVHFVGGGNTAGRRQRAGSRKNA